VTENPESAIDQSMSHEERAVQALESIAEALTLYAKIEGQRYEREYPSKPDARDATITRVQSADDRLRESQGVTGEPEEEWFGLREQEVIDKLRKASRSSASSEE
jgi:hypothetical protein